MAFSPVVALWFLVLLVTGIINIIRFNPRIFFSINPYYAIEFLLSKGLSVLGGVLLAVTGVEALFADLGHYNRQSIQWALAVLVCPSLMVAYLGQAAALTVNPHWISNTFYNSIPGGTVVYWFVFVLATASTIIASQAMILAIFSIVHQAIQLDCFPRVKVIHTDPDVLGRVYVPVVNWILMVLVVVVCLGFGSSQHLTNAYGLAVATVMFITTTLFALVMYFVWRFTFVLPLLFLIIFGTVDLAFWSATIVKFTKGAWFPCVVGIAVTCFMTFWQWQTGRRMVITAWDFLVVRITAGIKACRAR